MSFSATAGVRLKSVFWPYPQGPPRLSEVAFQRQACRSFLDLISLTRHRRVISLIQNALVCCLIARSITIRLYPSKTSTTKTVLRYVAWHARTRTFYRASIGCFGRTIWRRGWQYEIWQLPSVHTTTSGELWRLVGPCFVYDVMTGHVYDEWKKSGGTRKRCSDLLRTCDLCR